MEIDLTSPTRKPHFITNFANSQTSLRHDYRSDARPFIPILKTSFFTHSSSFEHQHPSTTLPSPTIMGKPLKAPLGYVPTWVQMRRLDLVQAADVDEDGTPVEPRKAARDLLKAVKRQRNIILAKVQNNHALITAATEFDHEPNEKMQLGAKFRYPGNEDLLSVLDLQLALGREIYGSLAAQRNVKRAIPNQTVTEANARTYGTMIDAIYHEYHTDDKPPVLGENAVARPGNLIVPSRKKPTTDSAPRVYYEAALKLTQAWPREEETIRREYAEAGWAISPLKRARDGDDDGNPFLPRQPRQGELSNKGKNPAVDEKPERGGLDKHSKKPAADAAGTVIKKEAGSDDDFLF